MGRVVGPAQIRRVVVLVLDSTVRPGRTEIASQVRREVKMFVRPLEAIGTARLVSIGCLADHDDVKK